MREKPAEMRRLPGLARSSRQENGHSFHGRGPGPYGYATAPLPDHWGFTSDAIQAVAGRRLAGTGAGMGGNGVPAWDTGDYFSCWADVADYSRYVQVT